MRALSLTLACAFAACGGSGTVGPTSDGSGAQLFAPKLADFAGYTAWHSFAFDSPGTSDGLTHTAGHRVVYLNHTPPHGSSAFPVGTIIVKDLQPGTPGAKRFAMAKRGGDYNAAGAPGWEWFEFSATTSDTAMVQTWSGVAPPAGENYSGSASGTCNDCHGIERNNDSVLATQLLLSAF